MKTNKYILYPKGQLNLKITAFFLMLFSPLFFCSAQKKEDKDLKRSKELLSDASLKMKNDNFPLAEADYRKAIALNPKDETGKYNLGTAYYNKEMNATAMQRFKQAAAVALNKKEKHKAYHNLGNTFMNEKKYKEAVETYKNALRNNPTDDETRYNLALAKKLLEEEEKKGDDKSDDKNKNDKNEDNKENKDKKNNENEKDDDKGDKKEDKDKGNEKDDKKEGDKNEDKGNPEQPKDEKKDQKQPVPGKLSTQQIKNLLEAMNNEEKKVQDKINAKKQKGAKIKPSKDW